MRVMYVDGHEDALSAEVVTEIYVRKNLYDELSDDVNRYFDNDTEITGLVIYTQKENVILVPCTWSIANRYVNDCFETDKLNLVNENVFINVGEEDWEKILDLWDKTKMT